MAASKPELRGFNPLSVKINHIRKLTVLYGDDLSGISLRLKRFAEVLNENGITADIVPDAQSMLSVLHASGLFASTVACVCKDGTGFIKADKESKSRLEELKTLVKELPDSSYVIVGIPSPKSAKQMEELSNISKSVNGVIREVSLPYETAMWLVEHAKTVGVGMSVDQSINAIDACDGNPRRAAELVDMLGDGILAMDKPSIALLSSNYGKSKKKIPNLRNPVAYKKIDELISIRRSLPDNSSGDRTFVLRLASTVSELLHASLDTTPNARWLAATSDARWHGNSYHNEARIRSIANSTGGTERYASLNSYMINRMLALYGFGDGVIATLPDLMSHILA